MNELPSVALVVVLNHLPYADLVRYRPVCKLWRHLIDHSVDKRDLILFVETNRRPSWWAHNEQVVNLRSSLQANYAAFWSMTFFGLFNGVKRLSLCFSEFFYQQKLFDNLARHFGSSLEHLQIDYESTFNIEEEYAGEIITQFKLAFRCLKTFCFSKPMDRIVPNDFEFVFDCDQLTHLLYPDLTFKSHSLTARVVSNLRVLFVKWLTYSKPLKLPHLQVLGSGNAPGAQFLASCLPSLLEFYFSTSFTENPTEANNSISEFLGTVERANRKVDVFWLGLKFTQENLRSNLQTLTQLMPGEESKIEIGTETLNYYKENRSIVNFGYLRYTRDFRVNCSDSFADQLDENADRDLMDNLAASLSTVRMGPLTESFNVAKLADLFQFVGGFLVNKIKPTDYDLLPVIFPDVRTLFLHPGVPDSIDLSFISEFKNLCIVSIRKPLSLALLNRILTNCPYLSQVHSRKEEKNISIKKAYKYIWPSFGHHLAVGSSLIFTGQPKIFWFIKKEKLFEALVKYDLVRKE